MNQWITILIILILCYIMVWMFKRCKRRKQQKYFQSIESNKVTVREDFVLKEYAQVIEFLRENKVEYSSIRLVKTGEGQKQFQVLSNGYIFIFNFNNGELLEVKKKWEGDTD